ncbi:hypothetical protein BGW36DRAFT_362407 [Talaromyces proteolyticus]|uniref:C2H2-type domain-containing protein n=1 Tax=Talaromyces proteolyticus TaxID=1131652 RepID=A0AAD4KMY0_9EURO|nr:uncharacterized protein BGW36DRAFT_362407 [Talaromyces proteolyticus]KAH8692860.1 hypothetical protein BGW36DRAFT_362407 [Talaromyces proteolyticus]
MSSYQNGLISDFSDMEKGQCPTNSGADTKNEYQASSESTLDTGFHVPFGSAFDNRGVFGTEFDSQLNAFGVETTDVDSSTLELAETLGTGLTWNLDASRACGAEPYTPVSAINASGYLNPGSYSLFDTLGDYGINYDATIPNVCNTPGYLNSGYNSYFVGPYNTEAPSTLSTIHKPSVLGNGIYLDVTHSSEPPLMAPSASGASYEAGLTYDLPDPAKATLTAPANLFSCNYSGCSRTFKRETWLTRHKEKHASNTVFSCHYPGCSKTFGRQAELNRHEKRHGPCDEFRCEDCDYQTDRRDHLSSHRKYKHQRTHKKHL